MLGPLRDTLRRVFNQSFRRVLGHSALMAGSSGVSAVIGLAQVVLLTRLLGATKYGQLVLLMSVTTTVRQLVGVRVWEWAMKDFAQAFVAKDASAAAHVVRTGFKIGAAINLLAFVIVAIASPLAGRRLLHDASLSYLVLGFGATLLFTWSYDTCFAVLRVAGRFRFLAVQGAAASLVRLLLVGAAVSLTQRLDLAVSAYVLFECLIAIWLYLVATRVFTRELGTRWHRAPPPAVRPPRKAMVRLLAVGAALDSLKILGARADVLALGWFATPSAVALYQAAWNFIDGVNRIVNPISMVLFSDFAKLGASRDGTGMLRLIKRLTLLLFTLTVPAAILVSLLSVELVRLAYGPPFAGAAPLLAVLSFCLLWLLALWVQPTHVSIGKPEWGLQATAAITVVKLALLALLVPPLGALGLAYTSLGYHLSYVLLLPLLYARVRRHVLSPEFRPVAQERYPDSSR